MAHKADELDINFDVNIVYNKVAFQKTLKHVSEHTDMLSKVQMDNIMDSNEFMRQKTYSILYSRYIEFKLEYIKQFMLVVTTSN